MTRSILTLASAVSIAALLLGCEPRTNARDADFVPLAPATLVHPSAGDASSASSFPVPRICHSRHLSRITEHELRECPANIVNETVLWHPDAIVVLGGGILAPGEPGCATAQRAFAAHELFEALGRAPFLLLSGHGPVEPARPVDDIESACVEERLHQELAAPALEGLTRDAIIRDMSDFVRAHAAALTEADYLCAGILAFYPPDVRAAIVTHLLFEPRSTSTVENANYSTPILGARRLGRAVILSTPVVHADHSIDNHPARALDDFRRDRKRGIHATRLGAVGCPFDQGGPPWSEFE